MHVLTASEIEAFASRPKVKRIAVENFLFSMSLEIGMFGNIYNLASDSVAYQWNGATQAAIRDGIVSAFLH